MGLNDTPRAERLHIGIFGRMNSGKSTLVNAFTGQDTAIVSDAAGTTADPVYRAMELHGTGPCVIIDTAGMDDEGDLGRLRVERTAEVAEKTDVAIMVIRGGYTSSEEEWIRLLRKKIPVIVCANAETVGGEEPSYDEAEVAGCPVIAVDAAAGKNIDALRRAVADCVPEDFTRRRILGGMAAPGSLVMLVIPQDIQAPKGRLILPQVQTIRELLDSRCTTVAVTEDTYEASLSLLNRAPDVIITDSKCFRHVYDAKPEESVLTSFSVLFAAYKGDIGTFTEGAEAVGRLREDSRVLIAEACSHVPEGEDIGTVMIPELLRRRIGEGLRIDNVRGSDFPDREELSSYDLVIHCGGCMFNRKHMMNRIDEAAGAAVPMTNYGIVLAALSGILDKITLPE